jgi:mannose-6-phosphate isomerase-like protein (cupin superfamily)
VTSLGAQSGQLPLRVRSNRKATRPHHPSAKWRRWASTDLDIIELGHPPEHTEIPCGVESGWHIHPGEEVGYILAGTVQMMIQDQPTLTLHAGDGFLMTPRLPHNALDIRPDTGRMLSIYIVEIGQPLATFVDGLTVPAAK